MFDAFGKGRKVAAARKAELKGDLANAAVLFAEAGDLGEAARVMILRGDSEPDREKRVQHYTQAAATAPQGHEVRALAMKKRALLVIALAGEAGGPASGGARHDLLEAARDLESVGEQEHAAQAYARAGDTEGEARALAQAGDVEKLETLLTEQQSKEREERRRHDAFAEIELLVASGRRREAIAAADALADVTPGSDAARARADQLRARRARGPVARLVIEGAPCTMVLGDEIVVGRTEGALQVSSSAISRRHLTIARDAGGIVVRDLASRNGTLLRGLAIAGSVPIGDGLELRLGKEVPMRITPSAKMEGAVEIELGGTRYLAPLGAARLPSLAWRVEQAPDGWIELASYDAHPAFISGVQLVPRATLLVGDAIARERGGPVALRIE
jgi:hypothetical protein